MSNSVGIVSWLAILTILLIVLKAVGYITWSWIWVLAPIWMSIVLIIFCIVAVIYAAIKGWIE